MKGSTNWVRKGCGIQVKVLGNKIGKIHLESRVQIHPGNEPWNRLANAICAHLWLSCTSKLSY